MRSGRLLRHFFRCILGVSISIAVVISLNQLSCAAGINSEEATTSAQKITTAGIASDLGEVKNFAVFANTFTLNGDMEGNIAVKTFSGNGNVGNTDKVYNSLLTFDLYMSITGGIANKTYKVGIYTDDKGTAPAKDIAPIPITVDANGNGGGTFSSLSGSTTYYTFLLDSNGNPIIDSSSKPITGKGSTPSTCDDNYLQIVNSASSEMIKSSGNSQQKTFFGNEYLLNSTTDNTVTKQTLGDGTYSLVYLNEKQIMDKIGGGSTNQVIIAEGDFPIAFSTVFANLSSLSSKLATGSFGSNIKVINVSLNNNISLQNALATYLNYTGQDANNDLTNNGIPLNANQYLVVNVDCESNSTVTIPKCPIGGVNYANLWDNSVASRVIWNFYNNSSSTYTPYTGTVTSDGSFLGTVLAPGATVNTGGTMFGAIYADKVTNHGEIHKMTFGSKDGTDQTANFTLSSLKVKKEWSDAETSHTQITVRLLQNGIPYNNMQATLSDPDWSYEFTDLPGTGYSVEEDMVSGYTPTYDTSQSGIVTITNTYIYTLPCAGGIGTGCFTGIGSAILLLSGALFAIYRRRRAAQGSG